MTLPDLIILIVVVKSYICGNEGHAKIRFVLYRSWESGSLVIQMYEWIM